MTLTQADFTRALLDPAAAVPDGLTNPGGAPAGKRFDVYRNNVAVSLTEALETAFPAIRKLVGEANFRSLAGAYLRRHPPDSPLMMHYGQDMPAFLATFAPTRATAYLPDVARLELARRAAYHAADAAPVAPDTFQTLPPDRLMAARLALAPAVRLIRSRHPVHAIWAYTMEAGPKPQPGGQNVLIARPEFDPVMTPLPPGGGTFVAALMERRRFAEAFDAAAGAAPDFDLSALLAILLGGNAITGIEEGEST